MQGWSEGFLSTYLSRAYTFNRELMQIADYFTRLRVMQLCDLTGQHHSTQEHRSFFIKGIEADQVYYKTVAHRKMAQAVADHVVDLTKFAKNPPGHLSSLWQPWTLSQPRLASVRMTQCHRAQTRMSLWTSPSRPSVQPLGPRQDL